MAIVLHQLPADGAKYGAFFYRNGRVLLRWRWLRNGSVERPAPLREIGSPRLLRSRQRRYGTDAIHELTPFELGGTVHLGLPGTVSDVGCQSALSGSAEPLS